MATLPSTPKPPETSDSPEVLSEEEMRMRAAAYAQKVYEQQLETYRAQCAQALARQEYERQWQTYMAFQNQRSRTTPAVRVDPKTGKQIFTFQEELKKAAEEASADEILEPQEDVPVSGDEGEESAPLEQDESVLSEEGAETPTDESPEDEAAWEEEGADAAADDSVEGEPVEEAVEGEQLPPEEEVVEAPEDFPVFSVFLLIVCAAVLAAVGYILMSDDPRFEDQRERFFSTLGMERAEAETPVEESEDSSIAF